MNGEQSKIRLLHTYVMHRMLYFERYCNTNYYSSVWKLKTEVGNSKRKNWFLKSRFFFFPWNVWENCQLKRDVTVFDNTFNAMYIAPITLKQTIKH